MRQTGGGSRDLSDAFSEFLTACARLLLWLGGLSTLITTGLLVYTCFRVTGDGGQKAVADALGNISLFGKIQSIGIIGLAIGSTYLFWGEELLGAIQLIGAAALFFAPLYVPMMIGGAESNDAVRAALGALQQAGAILGAIALVVLIVDIGGRARARMTRGSKADHLKYGKGVKEEADRQNVFMGKCWQLPYCRKFVRERCPIFYAKRTCWKERTGCMCEEEVIRNAMENKPIPKDALLAAKFIPVNHRLNESEKFERCEQCVIYNEHQRHKYRALLPSLTGGFFLVYLVLHGPLIDITQHIVDDINHVVNSATMNNNQFHAPPIFVEGLLFVGLLVALSYALKVLEFVVFKLKL